MVDDDIGVKDYHSDFADLAAWISVFLLFFSVSFQLSPFQAPEVDLRISWKIIFESEEAVDLLRGVMRTPSDLRIRFTKTFSSMFNSCLNFLGMTIWPFEFGLVIVVKFILVRI